MTHYFGIINNKEVKVEVNDGSFPDNFIKFSEEDIEIIAIVQKQLYIEEINELKQKLADTDYIACKIVEGESTREDYTFELEERREWRRRINELEEIIK